MSTKISKRGLYRTEINVAKQVFANTLPYYSIYVTNVEGIGNSAYTINNVGFEDSEPTYKLNVGPKYYPGMFDIGFSWLLIHELTHVWQSINSSWPASYIFDSAINQVLHGPKAYNYVPGADWDTYNVEQQASIVTDWFKQGQQASSPLYRYIRDHILHGKKMK